MTIELLGYPPEGISTNDWVAACSAIREYCGWHIAPSVRETVTLDGSGGSIQALPTLHLTDLHSIESDGSEVASAEWSATGMVRGHWSRRFRGVVADMTHGYETCPAVLLQVARSLATSSALPVGVASQSAGPFGISMAVAIQSGEASMPAIHQAALSAYRIPKGA